PGASDLVEAGSTGSPCIDQPGIARRTDDRHLQLSQIADDGRQHARQDLDRDAVAVHVVPWPFPVGSRVERPVAHRELDAVRDQSLMDVEGLLRDLTQGGQMALPAERTDRQVRIDAVDTTGVECPLGSGRDAAERDGLGGERLLDPVSLRLGALADRVRLRAQLGAHLARQASNRAEPEDVRRIALIRASGPLAVPSHEGVLRLRAGSIGAALRVTAEARERVGTSRRAEMDATQPGRVADRLAVLLPATPAVLGTEQIAEQLVPHDEERVDVQDVAVESCIREGGVLDQLARIAGVEHAIEVLATAEVDGLLQLLLQHDVVRDREIRGRERGRHSLAAAARALRVKGEGTERRRREEAEQRGATSPSPPPARRGSCWIRHGDYRTGTSRTCMQRALRRSSFQRNGAPGGMALYDGDRPTRTTARPVRGSGARRRRR